MKKFLALALCLILCLGFCSTAFAETTTVYGLDAAVMSKDLTVAEGIDFSSVNEFTFSFTGAETDAPAIDNQTITVSKSADSDAVATGTKAMSAVFPTSMLGAADGFKHAGVYTYTVKEETAKIENDTTTKPGIKRNLTVNDDDVYYIVRVYVINNTTYDALEYQGVTVEKFVGTASTGEKINPTPDNFKFKNTYTEVEYDDSNGVFNVTKEVKGIYGDLTLEFTVTIAVTIPNENATTDVTYSSDSSVEVTPGTWSGKSNTYTVKLANGETFKFTSLPVGSKVTVTETGAEYYKGKITDNLTTHVFTADEGDYGANVTTGQKVFSEKVTVTITNTRQDIIPEGIVVNNLPFVLIVVLALAGMAVFFVSNRRRAEEN